MFSRRIPSAECSTWYAVSFTINVAVVSVNLLSIIVFIKNSNLRTRAMYLAINLTVVDMFVGGSATSVIVLLFLLYGCGAGSTVFIFIAAREWPPILLVFFMIDTWVSLTSLTGIAVISLDRMHATFRPFRHRNTEKWVYGVTIAGVWILSAIIFIPSPIIRLYGNLHQQWQLVFPSYLWRSYCFLAF